MIERCVLRRIEPDGTIYEKVLEKIDDIRVKVAGREVEIPQLRGKSLFEEFEELEELVDGFDDLFKSFFRAKGKYELEEKAGGKRKKLITIK